VVEVITSGRLCASARALHAAVTLAEALDRLRFGDDLGLAGHGGQMGGQVRD